MNGLIWSDEDRACLQSMWVDGSTTSEIGQRLNQTQTAVQGKAKELGLPFRPASNWTPAMDAILLAAFGGGESFRDISLKVGLSRSACIGRASRLGLTRIKPTGPKPLEASPKPVGEFDLRVKRSATVLTFRPKFVRNDTDSPPLPGSRPRPWIERDVKGGPALCGWPVDVPGADVQHSCCMPRALDHKSYCAAHADLSVGRVSMVELMAAKQAPTISPSGAETAFQFLKSEENQSGRAVRKHQPYPGQLQTNEV